MKKLFAGISLILMSVILYSANAISVSIARTSFGGQSEVGYSMLLFSGITFTIGIIVLLAMEKDIWKDVTKDEEDNV